MTWRELRSAWMEPAQLAVGEPTLVVAMVQELAVPVCASAVVALSFAALVEELEDCLDRAEAPERLDLAGL